MKRVSVLLPRGYRSLLEDLKLRIRSAQIKAATAVNHELVGLYFYIGRQLAKRTRQAGWGDKAVEHLAGDLRAAFPGMSGFSRTNLFAMRQVYLAWTEAPKTVQQLVGQIPWGHHVLLTTKVKSPNARTWYLREAVTNGWSRSVLSLQIEGRLHERQGKALTNFARTLPAPQSDLASETLKDPYLFDFLSLGPVLQERDIERGLVDHVQSFLLELGVGFAFVGRQVHLEVGGEDFYLDLLFYHLKLRCFVVIELKAASFRPEFVGKMNFYLSVVDSKLRHPDDQPSIGLLLCKSKNQLMVEYALRDLQKPIGVSQWETQLVSSLPDVLQGSLPTIEELEAELGPGLPSPAGSS
ncbi:MAG TPA: PDDEXK nuclease domain-containing protein [Thermoanaerobaculia bacterium]|nr:PDDEXK nuclease domain-containing protein [Thermoanaerobaculia bacterium]